MAIGPGTRLGPYEVTALIGEGGMGQVYRATDTNLGRHVAIKVLPDAFATDPERLARFEREAKTLASLNHPNIAQIYGLEKADGIRALVMELVEGPTLADRIARGPIPVDEALPIAKQIAEALEAAHEQGIIHRDLKPANIKLRPDGTVKVLDFGLAKALEPVSAGSANATASPTITSPAMMTGVGVLLGTAAYMSPEQARGKSVDKRTDIWAFGCVLYEMLTGRQAFTGEDVVDTIGAVLHKEVDWTLLPAGLSATLRSFIRQCLHKNAKQRLPDIATMRLVLEGAFDTGAAPAAGSVVVTRTAWRWAGPVAVACLATAAAVGIAAWSIWPSGGLPSVNRFDYVIPQGQTLRAVLLNPMALSPDGRHFVYNTGQGLFLRRLGELEARLIPGTEPVLANPFFSPDGQSVAYFTPGRLSRIAVSGGTPVVICPVERTPLGASWDPDGTILFGQPLGIMRVSANGGTPELVIPAKAGEQLGRPQLLPDGERVLFDIATTKGQTSDTAIAVQSLRTAERRVVLQGGSGPRYVETGHLVYAVGDTLFAIAFDARRLQTSGGPVSVVAGLARPANQSPASTNYGISRDGTLVYLSGGVLDATAARRILVWVNRDGREDPLPVPPRAYMYPRISPDGTTVALDVRDQQLDIWVWNIGRQALTRLTFDPGEDEFPVWSPDGNRIAFSSSRGGGSGGQSRLFSVAADGTGPVEQLVAKTDGQMFPGFFSPDGSRLVIFGAMAGQGQGVDDNDDIAVVSMGTDDGANAKGEAKPLLRTTFAERNPSLSPDGRWMAYESNESGQSEIYVRPFPDVDSGRWQVSTGGGVQPLWARNGRELFYRNKAALVAVAIQAGPSFVAGNPKVMFEGQYAEGLGGRMYDVSPDGQRFLMIKAAPVAASVDGPAARFIIVQHWTEELKRLVPVK